jgi:hypothetical protein
MTQALAAFTSEGVIMASDSRATRFNADGQMLYFGVEKLFPLGRYAGVVSGGSGVSVPLTHGLVREVERRRLVAIEDIVDCAADFLSHGYGRFLAEHGPEPEAEFRRLNFILAGYSLEQEEHPYQIYLLESENNALPFQVHPVRPLVVMPRNLSMETRLFQAVQQGLPLEQLLELSKEFLIKMSTVQPGVGPPFVFATITRAGFRRLDL